jgi:multicomponent Na+:H+ antiporter subunit G
VTVVDGVAALLVAVGALFFIAGTAGLLRFPDVYTRLHALTKADNLGLGLLTAGLAVHADSWWIRLKLLLIWLLVLLATATACHLVGGAALRRGIAPWRSRSRPMP